MTDNTAEIVVVACRMNKRWVPHFLGMLAEMERLGRAGSSRAVTFYADGDGDFRPRFTWDARLSVAGPHRAERNGDTYFDAG